MSEDPTYLVLLGPPGAGKGTQAVFLEQELGLKQISSGDLFRENLKNETELGVQVKGFMDRGELVPDDLTIAMVRERISRPDCDRGAILDGFPRTLEQARALDKMLAEQGNHIRMVPMLDVADEELIDRLTGRLVCRNCGATYHRRFKPPTTEGICDVCGGELYQRPDDELETVKIRLYVYYKQTSPLIGYYFARDLLVRMDGDRPLDEIKQDLLFTVRTVL
ncbi:MAG: adenylate kinase [Chloroflexota bacterium]|nr:adenylate kinase [Chloroflexota bacterium]